MLLHILYEIDNLANHHCSNDHTKPTDPENGLDYFSQRTAICHELFLDALYTLGFLLVF